jgi:hypothetical protein
MPRRRSRSRARTTTTLAAVLTLSLLGAACGGDDDEDAATDAPATTAGETSDGTAAAGAAGGDTGEFCDAALALETAPSPPFSDEGPEAEAAAIAGWAGETIQPLAAEAVATAPAELEEALATMSGAVDAMAVDGDTAAFDSPEFAAADAEAHAWEMDNCGWASQEVTTVDYAFEGLPDEMPAGPTSFEMTNEGAELHEVIIVRRNEGTTQPLEELLALPEEEVGSLITEAGATGPVAAGESVYTVADLTPGDYVVVCFVPTGMTAFDGPPPDGMPHAMAGMTAEFTVT